MARAQQWIFSFDAGSEDFSDRLEWLRDLERGKLTRVIRAGINKIWEEDKLEEAFLAYRAGKSKKKSAKSKG